MEALFRLDGDLFVPSELTRGGWTDDTQHGSPPSGLLGRAIEKVPTAVPMRVVRLTIDLFRPVPLIPLAISTEVIRQGRRIQVVEARLKADGLEVGRAMALKIRSGDAVEVGEGNAGPERFVPGPGELERLDLPDSYGRRGDMTRFHTDAVEIRSLESSFATLARGRSWFRLLYPLVAGEEMTPFQRVATMADLANGNSQALDPLRWLFVNPDITVYTHRLPEDEWLAMDSVTRQTGEGIGVTDTTMYDVEGPIGLVVQAQLIDRRPAQGESGGRLHRIGPERGMLHQI